MTDTVLNVNDPLSDLTSGLSSLHVAPSSDSGAIWPYVYINTEADLKVFYKRINGLVESTMMPHIFLDSEGRELGTRDGVMALLQIGIPNDKATRCDVDVYLVDVITFDGDLKTLWDTLKNVLSNEKITKVMWDGRQDYSELKHGHGVTLNSVLDLQLAELLFRMNREFRPQSWIWPIVGMSRAVSEFGIFNAEETKSFEKFCAHVKAIHLNGGSREWLQRPLSSDMKSYAALDIYKLAALYKEFKKRKLLSSRQMLSTISSRYLHIHEEGKRAADDKYHSHGLLPLEIVELGYGGIRRCHGCERDLHTSSYHERSVKCTVCVRIDKRWPR